MCISLVPSLLAIPAMALLVGCGGGGQAPAAAPSSNATLAHLALSQGVLTPPFHPQTTAFAVGLPLLTDSVTITATAADAGATIRVNSLMTASGLPSEPITLGGEPAATTVEVTAADGATTRVYTVVFNRTVAGQQAYVKASNTGTNDQFGYSVALSGDTLVVGARVEASNATSVNGDETDNSFSGSGAAYVFVRTGSGWTQQAYLKASNTGAGHQFGASVAVSGDTIVVGAYGEDSSATGVNAGFADNSAPDSGAAYVFVRTGTTWAQQAYVKASNTEAGDEFGVSVDVSGDTLIVGARYEGSSTTGVNGNQADNSAPDSGAAYVFVRTGTTWTQQAYLKAPNTEANDGFACSVGVSGDTVVVGAFGESSNATGVNGNEADNSAGVAGAAYVFLRTGTSWAQQAYLKASNTGAGDWFGTSVAISGDTLVVGADVEASNATGVNGSETNNSASASGAAYIFARTGSSWTQQAYLKASNAEAGDRFGISVALSGDTVVVGAWAEDSSATGVNGNGADNSAGGSGAAYVFVRTGAAWAQKAYLKASNAEASDLFGGSVGVSGTTLVVGSRAEDSNAAGLDGNGADNSAGDSGAAYVFL